MSDATAYLEDLIADIVETSGIYVSLHTALPTGGNEIVGGSYARRPIAYSRAGTEPTVLSNSGIVEFAVASSNWGVITHFAIWDALAAGNMLIRKSVIVPKTINIGDVARFLIGEIDVSIN